MKSKTAMIKYLILTLLFVLTFGLLNTTQALTLYEINPYNGNKVFSQLEKAFNKISQSEINKLEAEKRPSKESIEIIRVEIESIPLLCDGIRDARSSNRTTKTLNEELDKLAQLESLKDIVEDLKTENTNYLGYCIDANQYASSAEKLNNSADEASKYVGYNEVLNNSVACSEDLSQIISNTLKRFRKDNNEFERTVANATSLYNTRLERYQTLIDENKNLANKNSKAGDISEKNFVGINFLNLKLDAAIQEQNLLNDSIVNNYIKISNTQKPLEGNLAKKLQKENNYAISLDKGGNWIVLNSYDDYVAYSRAIAVDESIYNDIKALQKNLDSKRIEQRDASIQKVAKESLLQSSQSAFEKNSKRIEANNKEINSIYPEFNQYKQFAQERVDTKADITRKFADIETVNLKCGEQAKKEYSNLKDSISKLNEDFTKELDRRSKESLSKKITQVLQKGEAETINEPDQLFNAISQKRQLLNELNTCTASDKLDIEIASETISNTKVNGIDNITFVNEEITPEIIKLTNIVTDSNVLMPLVNTDINYFYIQLQKLLKAKELDINKLNIAVNTWNQDIVVYNNTYASYSCPNNSWKKSGTKTLLEVEYGDCKSSKNIEIEYVSKDKEVFSEGFINSLNTNIPTNYNLYGQCQTNT